ncbi:MAG TPA: SDR family oxidoreductase [Xanthobacteraceae bacterium]|nr:SDR family oxidoreductase [Xanthobacteraceae bacterium]
MAGRPVTLITGASTGIGAEFARIFSARGHELLLVARSALHLNALADEIAAAGLKRPHILVLDLLRADATTRIEHELRERGLEAQYVVNNAGFGLFGDAAALDRPAQLAMVDLNVRALTDLSLRFVDSLVRNRGGILNVASVAGFVPGPGMAVYHATKAYVLSFSEALHYELAPRGVRVTVLCPGPVPTEFQARAGIPSGNYPSMLTRSAASVARAGYKGLMRGRRLVIPGFENKMVTLFLRLLPRRVALELVGFRGRRAAKRIT